MLQQDKRSFLDYDLSEEILEALSALGYQKPTDIQTEVIPVMILKCLFLLFNSDTINNELSL